jgi:hypothetical protein
VRNAHAVLKQIPWFLGVPRSWPEVIGGAGSRLEFSPGQDPGLQLRARLLRRSSSQ